MNRFRTIAVLVFCVLAVGANRVSSAAPGRASQEPTPGGAMQAAPGAGATQGTPPNNAPRTIAPYFAPASPAPKPPDAEGFLRRWLLLEPITKPNRTNTVFTDSYVRSAFATQYFPGQFTTVPRDGDKVTVAGQELAWHALDSPTFTGSPEQLWRIDQLTDGTYRIMPKSVPGSKEPLALTAVGHSTPTLATFDPKSDKARWTFKRP